MLYYLNGKEKKADYQEKNEKVKGDVEKPA
jgi:hypothetical protein